MSSGTMNPPQGAQRMVLLGNNTDGRRLFITFFETREEVEAAEQRFEQMGDEVPEDVRGRRISVDVYEVAVDQAL